MGSRISRFVSRKLLGSVSNCYFVVHVIFLAKSMPETLSYILQNGHYRVTDMTEVLFYKSNFFHFLSSYLQLSSLHQQLGRSIFCLGLLIRYGNSLLSSTGNRRIDVGSSLSLFKRYLQMDDFVLKVRSLQVSLSAILLHDRC